MFESIQTTNFRKLRDTRVTFDKGLTAIRAANESGKSTLLEAIAYALFGSDALRESLSDVVTWGEKESSLKVVLNWRVNQNKVQIRRGKSGAEIEVDGKLVATGQKEVTRFVESLLGAPPKMAGKLMLANQAALRGALEEGPTATAQMIEQLSNFAVIDEVIQLVTENLPTGSLKGLEQQVTTLSQQLAASDPGVLDVSAEEQSLAVAEAAYNIAFDASKETAGLVPEATKAADVLRGLLRSRDTAQATVRTAEDSRVRITDALSRLKPESAVSPEQVAALRADLAAFQDRTKVLTAYREVEALVEPEVTWDGTAESFKAEVASVAQALQRETLRYHQAKLAESQVLGRIIKEQNCAFCGKDLKDVPEVATHNSALNQELVQVRITLAEAATRISELQADRHALEEIEEIDRKYAMVAARHATYAKVHDTRVPAVVEWTGPDVTGSAVDPAPALRAAEAEVQRAARDQGQQQQLLADLERVKAESAAAGQQLVDLAPAIEGNRAIQHETDLKAAAAQHAEQARALAVEAESWRRAITSKQQVHAAQVAGQVRIKEAHDQAVASMAEMAQNNVLLQKLRAARPKVADKLWSIILSTVSHYFSQIRGVQSVVSKDDGGFKVDGKPITGLSGSALDSLGLGIRIALTKTFLPNNDFMVLDEPGAACDDNREANMLATLATANFDQILLVTHSAVADSYADQVVTL